MLVLSTETKTELNSRKLYKPNAVHTRYKKLVTFFLSVCSPYIINEEGGYVVFLVLSESSFIRDFRVIKELAENNVFY